MRPRPRQVTVTTQLQEITYDWPTKAEVTPRGDLKLWQGWRMRAFHPAGEWTRYTMAAPQDPGRVASAL